AKVYKIIYTAKLLYVKFLMFTQTGRADRPIVFHSHYGWLSESLLPQISSGRLGRKLQIVGGVGELINKKRLAQDAANLGIDKGHRQHGCNLICGKYRI
ncbi:MAG: hypothetical protein K2G86_06865, partial [Prevotella sp.]|nr:hypothetical protein [Prevotella sp.]